MMFRSEILIAVLFLLASSSTLADDDVAADKKTLTMTKTSFNEQVPKNNHFVMFYAPWCGHCKRLHPTWDQLAEKYNLDGDREVVIANVDCTTETELCSDNQVTGYPTLKFFKKNSKDEAERYRGSRDLDSLVKFVSKSLGQTVEDDAVVPEDATVENGLYILTDRSVEKHLTENDGVFVKFYAPWCGHCQRLAPAWESLAKEYENDKSTSIAKLDCTAHSSVCQKYEVRGYPTLVYFKKGKKEEVYRGGRSLEELKDFVKSMAGDGASGSSEADKVPELTEKSKVEIISKENFEEKISKGLVFIKFYAPWCGHCKRLAPTWDELASKYEEVEDIMIAKVDCTAPENDDSNKALCNDEGVNGFPTMNIYKDGKKLEEYRGKREISDLVTFIQKHASSKKDEL